MSDEFLMLTWPLLALLVYGTIGVAVGTLIRYAQLRFREVHEDPMSAFLVAVLVWPLAIGLVPYLLGTWLYEMEKEEPIHGLEL